MVNEKAGLTAFGYMYILVLLHSLGSRIKPYGLTDTSNLSCYFHPICIDNVRKCIYSRDFVNRSNLRKRVASFVGFKLNFISVSAISLLAHPLLICYFRLLHAKFNKTHQLIATMKK